MCDQDEEETLVEECRGDCLRYGVEKVQDSIVVVPRLLLDPREE